MSESGVDEVGVEREEARYFQDSKGLLPLSPVDTDARWRTSRPGKPPWLNYQDNAQGYASKDRGGFILSGESPTLQKGNGRPCHVCLTISPCRRSRWQPTPPTMRDG